MRTLVVAPHPDDGSIAAGGLIQQAQGDVTVVHVTAGDGFYRDAAEIYGTLGPSPTDYLNLGLQRIAEARAAAQILGVPAGHDIVLGFPDGQIAELLAHPDMRIQSRHTWVAEVPYPSAFRPGTPYTGRELRTQLTAIIAQASPAVVVYPSTYDHNHDHRAIGALVESVVPQGAVPRRPSYLVHHDLYPGLPWGLRYDRVLRPEGLPLPWVQVILTLEQEETKRKAIAAHRSQMLAMADWLLGFVACNEPFHRGVTG